jgi:guanylate kinase
VKQIIIGGLSGSGKDTVRNTLHALGMVRKGVTCTTRKPRAGAVNGEDYDYLTLEEYDDAHDRGALGEETVYVGNPEEKGEPVRYGIFWNRIREAEHATLPTCWILDTTGVERMRELFPGEVTSVFLYANIVTLADRMKVRGESNETIQRRLKRAAEEKSLGLMHFDHAIDTTDLTPADVVLRVLELVAPVPMLYKGVS